MSSGSGRDFLRGAVWWAALVVWVAFVWSRSLATGEASDSQSLWVVARLRGLFCALGVSDVAAMNHLVRKAAHFSEYLVLGLLAFQASRPLRGRGRTASVICGLVTCCVPVVDETLQLFVNARSGQASDVVLDICGACVGLIVMHEVHARSLERG
jgi:VanZ family protein